MRATPLIDLSPTAASHFRLYYFAAVLQVLDEFGALLGSIEALLEQFPFLAGYQAEIASTGLDLRNPGDVTAQWREALHAWESALYLHLPLRELRQSGELDHKSMILLLTIGLIEEDARFGLVFETVQGLPGQHRPTVAMLSAWWRQSGDSGSVRARLRKLQEMGLIQVVNPDAPRLEWALQTPASIWDAMRGDTFDLPTPWIRNHRCGDLAELEDLIVPENLQMRLLRLSNMLLAKESRTLIVRGPSRNGRRTILGAIARRLEFGMLEVQGPVDSERWKLLGPLSTLLHAMPVVVLELAPGDSAQVPELMGYEGPVGLVMGKNGVVTGRGIERSLSLVVESPNALTRQRLWQKKFHGRDNAELDEISRRFRMTSGNICRAAEIACDNALLADRAYVTLPDVCHASRALNCQTLDSLATRLTLAADSTDGEWSNGDWGQLAVAVDTMQELGELEARCRYRESLPAMVSSSLAMSLAPGLRALFSGPSGTGKSLAARLLASSISKDIYRVDLSAVVNKYIGETEKNLNRLLTLAEELDVILLLDEGDALLTQRTGVQSSNDRYANLETNYLLQRLEAYEGIFIVTTNAADRIDSAFQRRMDVIIDFRPPEACERRAILQLHMPVRHQADEKLLGEIAVRCTLNGGQIRNVVLHAALLSASNGGVITNAHLESAVQREYRKSGGVCPLRRIGGSA